MSLSEIKACLKSKLKSLGQSKSELQDLITQLKLPFKQSDLNCSFCILQGMPSMQSHFSSTIHQAPANPLLNLTTKICSSDSFMQEKGSCIEKDLHYYIKGICNPSQHRSFFLTKYYSAKAEFIPLQRYWQYFCSCFSNTEKY